MDKDGFLVSRVSVVSRLRVAEGCSYCLKGGRWLDFSRSFMSSFYVIILHHRFTSSFYIIVLVLYCMEVYGTIWYCMVLYGTVWYCMVLYGTLWYCMVLYDTV